MDQYKNALWSATGSWPTADSNTVSMFRPGVETSSKIYPLETFEEWQIPVRLREDAEERLGMKSDVVLMLRTDSILLQGSDLKTWTWNIRLIRSYGYNETSFHFEAGRKSTTGEGVFTFFTDKGHRISHKVTEMKEYIKLDIFCQKGKSPEEIIHLFPFDDSEQLGLGRVRGYSLKNRRSMIRVARSNSQPDLNTTSCFPVTHRETKVSIRTSQGAQTLPRRLEIQETLKEERLLHSVPLPRTTLVTRRPSETNQTEKRPV